MAARTIMGWVIPTQCPGSSFQSDGQAVQWKGWFAANGMQAPQSYGLAFDRSSMGIAAAAGGLGIALNQI
ncbi:UNVERIFIED_ORG: hypothetical protein J2X80_004189 [Pseudomonas fluorescens]|nr:hypothetical protein [Pseudomonas fluorescens]